MPVRFTQKKGPPDPTRAAKIIRQELTRAFLRRLFPAVEKEFKKDVRGWVNEPEILHRLDVRGRTYNLSGSVDHLTDSGRIYWWVSRGTGREGPKGQSYPIAAVNVPSLIFDVPYKPITYPPMGLGYNPNAPPRTINTKFLMHSGIRPRKFHERIQKYVNDPSNRKGLIQVTQDAYLRAFVRIMKI